MKVGEGRKPPARQPDIQGSLGELIRRAERQGDSEARAELIRIFDADPELWRSFGDLAAQAERALRTTITLNDPLKGEAFDRGTAVVRQALLGPDPSPLERLLVDRVVLCWIQVNHTDYIDAANLQQYLGTDLGEAIERRQDRAHRRFLAAAKTLAQVRRLAVPVVQMNIGQNQVNILSGADSQGQPDVD